MDNVIKHYYEAEMRYLREAGKEFAQAHPDRAAMLNLDAVGDRDPYVEQLFEGFAFLMGRLRQKIDEGLPELTEGIISLLWPHYLRMIPSLSIVELQPNYRLLTVKERVDAGFYVQSAPIGETKTCCKYRTTQPIDLLPLSLIQAGIRRQEDGRSSLFLTFEFGPNADRSQTNLSRLRLYLNAERPTATALYYALVNQVTTASLQFPGHSTRAAQPLNLRVVPVGFAHEERLWFMADNAFAGYQHLLEYFTFPEKFMFVDLIGVQAGQIPDEVKTFEITLGLRDVWPNSLPFNERNVRLHCAPVINLFSMEADPISVNHLESEYLLRPLLEQDGHIDIYSVDTVQAISQRGRTMYAPFTHFRHCGGMLRDDAPERYFHTRVRRGVSGLHDTWLILGGQQYKQESERVEETLSLHITGTNGLLPRKALRNTAINQLCDNQTGVLGVRNVCSPTLPCYPPVNDRFHWRVLSHMAPNYLSLMTTQVLRGTLALYDWTDDVLNRRRLEGIVDVQHSPIQRRRNGLLERGVSIEITLNVANFASEGDIFLFGEILHHFFALYAELNLFTRLTLILLPTGKRMSWNDSKTARFPL